MDVLERLADVAVPPVPPPRAFTEGVRRKLHPRLLALHVIEFACGAMAWSLVHLAAGLLAAVRYTVTGTWPETESRERRDGRERQ
jgi:hypothetical protein